MKTLLALLLAVLPAAAQETVPLESDGHGRRGLAGRAAAQAAALGLEAAPEPAAAEEPPAANASRRFYVSDKAADVYSELAERIPGARGADKADIMGKTLWRGTQVDRGETVEFVGPEVDGWARVNIPGQNYSGWIRRSALSEDAGLAASFPMKPVPADAPADARRKAFLDATASLEGVPYVWGGRSPQGVDCSGLVQLAFSYIGMGRSVPRTADEQSKASKPVDGPALKPGDLVFTEKLASPGKVSHVMVYVGEGQLREAPKTGMNVRTIGDGARLGADLKSVTSGAALGRYKVTFGSFFQD